MISFEVLNRQKCFRLFCGDVRCVKQHNISVKVVNYDDENLLVGNGPIVLTIRVIVAAVDNINRVPL